MVKILVTGGAGNIGSALAARLIQDPDVFVVIVDNLVTGSLSKVPKTDPSKLTFIRADVNNMAEISAIMLRYCFDYVFHYAALVGVERTIRNPINVLDDIEGIKNILSLAKNTGVRRVFYSSSSEVYGEPVELPQCENTTPLNSKLPYAIVKNVGEAFFKTFQATYGLDYTVFRFFNTYGPNQSQDFVVPRFLHAALNNQPLRIYGDGSQTRTFCYVNDNVDACYNALTKGMNVNDTVNIGSDLEISIKNLAHYIVKTLGSNSEVLHLPPLKEGDMSRRKPDITKMKKLLGRELMSVEEGIGRLVAHVKLHSHEGAHETTGLTRTA